jgi:hypothetical protein
MWSHGPVEVFVRLLITVPLLAAVPLLAPAPLNGHGTHQIKGTVVETGTAQPLVGAIVEIEVLGLRARTDSAGEFIIAGVPEGDHWLEIHHTGYQPLRRRVAIPLMAPLRIVAYPYVFDLEGLEVRTQRLEPAVRAQTRRRNSHPNTVSYIGPEEVSRAVGTLDRLLPMRGVDIGSCRYDGGHCPDICIDDRQIYGGLDELNSYRKEEIHSIEVFRRDEVVRVYTMRFMEAVASGRARLLPYRFCPIRRGG